MYLGQRRKSLQEDCGDEPKTAPPPSIWLQSELEYVKGGRQDLGTTLGRACSRWCRERRVRSKIGWLAGSRDSHHVSRFAAFFILARAEISVDGSCFGVSRFFRFFICQKKTRRGRGVPFSSHIFWGPSSPLFAETKEKKKHRQGLEMDAPFSQKEKGTPTFRVLGHARQKGFDSNLPQRVFCLVNKRQ